jgi:hypothetical protein
MLYISANNEYPRHIGDVKLVQPGFKDGDELPAGWRKVEETQPPTAGTDQLVIEAAPKEIKGVMTQQWLVRDMTAEEIERRDAPLTAKAKLLALGLTEAEVGALVRGLVR